MATFSKQDRLPSLPVPDLNETLDKYLKSTLALIDDEQKRKTIEAVEVFRSSETAEALQKALVERGSQMKNWLEDWWYDAYLLVRLPLTPYLSLAACNSLFPPLEGSQICRAAEVTYHTMRFWEKLRKQTIPIIRSRGVVWDMHQYHCLFNACRVPDNPKDRLVRYFKTEEEGPCPSHIVVLCRGNVWKLEMLCDGELKQPEVLYDELCYIEENSEFDEHHVSALTCEDRDGWAKVRSMMISRCPRNERSIQIIEEACFCLTLADEVYHTPSEYLHGALMGGSHMQWADKSMNVIACKDGRILYQGEHSNLDAIVVMHVGDDAAMRSRKHIWKSEESMEEPSVPPELLEFDLTQTEHGIIDIAKENYERVSASFRVESIMFSGYGNNLVRQSNLYTDTVIQIALQLAFLKTHNSFAPIYETASTRQFYHGRTETVRGCTQEMVAFGKAVMEGKDEKELKQLFIAAYNEHNQLMDDAMNGRGIDRHLYGLSVLFETYQEKCAAPVFIPAIFTDEAWKITGGDGNFLLSTSFIGYMGENDEIGSHGYVAAMLPDGYGAFYRVGRNRLQITITDWTDSKSDLEAFGKNLIWSLTKLASLFTIKSNI